MTVAIVHRLEMIGVDEQTGEGLRVAFCAGHLLSQTMLEVAAIVEAGQAVGESDQAQALAIDCIFETDRSGSRLPRHR